MSGHRERCLDLHVSDVNVQQINVSETFADHLKISKAVTERAPNQTDFKEAFSHHIGLVSQATWI